MRIPSITHRSTTDEDSRPVSPGETAPPRDGRDDRPTRADRRRAEAERAEANRVATGRVATAPERTAADQAEADRVGAERVVTGPRPRSSGLATFALIIGVLAAAAVATGVLAAPGLALGVVATLLGVGGVSATGRRHIAGRSEALFAVVLGLAAVVFGILALTDSLSWLSSNTNEVTRLRDWLYDQMPWLDNL